MSKNSATPEPDHEAPEFSPLKKKRQSLLDSLNTAGTFETVSRTEIGELAPPPADAPRKKSLLLGGRRVPADQAPELDPEKASGGPPQPPDPAPAAQPARKPPRRSNWLLSAAGWVVALGSLAFALYLWQTPLSSAAVATEAPAPRPTATSVPEQGPPPAVDLPAVNFLSSETGVRREPQLHTIVPNRPRTEVITYVVDQGDAIFSIADSFNLEPETILWANYDLLNDNPDFLEVGMELNVPPVDGVLYQWQEGDTLEAVAAEFEADLDEILEFSGNQFDLAAPEVAPGQWVMLPEGHREFRQWLIPTINRGNAGVSSAALGPGACSGSYTGAVGSGAFIWPSSNHTLSGNDFWSGHLAIDIGAVQGDPIFASDAGVVVFSGWANGGYGYTVMVDHGNGYQTLYAHLSSASAYCGASVGAGTVVGAAGSTGNSTGTHLHFEVRLNGGFINPWFVLPPP